MSTDDVAAILAGIRERFDTVTGIPLEALPLEPEQAAAFAALVMDIPALVAAVEDALELHQPIERRQGWKPSCSYDNHRWPCPEVEAITAALAGTEAGKDE